MRLISAFIGLTILFCINMPAFSWQVSLQSDDAVVINNDREMKNVNAYLVWYDKDAKTEEARFFSWTLDQKTWKAGIVPALKEPTDLSTFKSLNLTTLPKVCPEDHRCFLAMVAIPPGQNPVDNKHWRAASLLPLTVPAGRDRLPGQQFFLPAKNQNQRLDGGDDVDADEEVPQPTAPSVSMEEAITNDTQASASGTEKPDIFRLVGDKLLFANNQAQKFQVIDLSDPTRPHLVGEIKLTGYPSEIYVLDGYYVLLQTNYDYRASVESQLIVIQQATDGQLTVVQELPIAGRLIESRRRGLFIYTVTESNSKYKPHEESSEFEQKHNLMLNVLQINAGQLSQVDKAELPGYAYSAVVAIFADHLVVTNHDPDKKAWRSTQIQVFDLAQATDPLVELPIIDVPGQVPSEFHLSVKDQLLRVVYGPADRRDGSTLAIYDLSTEEPTIVGEVGKIAPGEDLFATRFVDNRAFVVTFERKDPLWAIDLTDPANPTILGELEVPGWSEKLFFHEDRLFAVGIDDQPLPDEEARWVRRVALSLFNVADPTQPTLINRFTPLAGQVNSSWSPALDDERALFLNWEEAFAALPINSWESEVGSHLQIVSLATDRIEDAGLVNMPIAIQRSLALDSNTLAALGDQALLTLQWGTGKPQVLAELELAINTAWINFQNNTLWAASRGQKGYNRLYQYAPADLAVPMQRWNLPRNYDSLVIDEKMAVFYNYNPLAVQAVNLTEGQLQPAHALEAHIEEDDVRIPYDYYWYNRSQPLLYQGQFFIAEQKPLAPPKPLDKGKPMMILPMPEDYDYYSQWQLRRWDLQTNPPTEAPTLSIPGEPVAFTRDGHLITQEGTEEGQLRLNLVTLGTDTITLSHSQEIACPAYSPILSTKESLYVNCQETYSYPPIGVMEESLIVVEDSIANVGTVRPTVETVVLSLDPMQGFAEQGRWTFEGYRHLYNVANDVVLMSSGGGSYYRDVIDVAYDVALVPSPDQFTCEVHRLTPQTEPQLLKQIEEEACYMTALSTNQLWIAKGFAGISNISW